MSLQTRLTSLAGAIAADIKALYARSGPAGGIAGQALVKSSSADYAAQWSTIGGGTISAGLTPPSGAWQQPSNFLSSGAGTPASGSVYLVPFDIGPASLTIQSLGVNVTTALVLGGGAVTYSLGLYPDDGSGGAPAWTSRITSGTINPTTTGTTTLAYTGTLTPGRYWAALLYVAPAAPTTPAQFSCMANASPSLWTPNNVGIGVPARAIKVTASTMPTTVQTLGITGNIDAPVIGLRRA